MSATRRETRLWLALLLALLLIYVVWPGLDLPVDEGEHARAARFGTQRGGDRLSPRRPLVENAHVEIAIKRERE